MEGCFDALLKVLYVCTVARALENRQGEMPAALISPTLSPDLTRQTLTLHETRPKHSHRRFGNTAGEERLGKFHQITP